MSKKTKFIKESLSSYCISFGEDNSGCSDLRIKENRSKFPEFRETEIKVCILCFDILDKENKNAS